ncbi:MAG TPA: diguanylate cyclase [Gemmatimonadales bacterium]|nr:diguanylate cyclase [Gemmatimonadales bacterium]
MTVGVWDETLARAKRTLRLDSVRSKVVALAAVAMLLPLLATLLSTRRAEPPLSDSVTHELGNVSAEAARLTDAWVDERLADLRATANSYVVSENLARLGRGGQSAQALTRLREHINAARERCAGCETLVVADARGHTVAASAGRTGGMQLGDRVNSLRTGDAILGEPAWDAGLGRPVVVLAVPVRDADGRLVGALSGKVSLRAIGELLQRLPLGPQGDAFLMTDQGKVVAAARGSAAELMHTRLSKPTLESLYEKEDTVVTYRRGDGLEVLGTVRRVSRLRLAAVAELPRTEAGRASTSRPGAGPIVAALVVGAAMLAGGLGVLVLRPIGRLAEAAARVASGDLTVELPAGGAGEIGYVTQVFNSMVVRLREREAQGELERLSVTDALTGLYNRRHLMGTLANEVQRSRRLRRTFSVLLADVDHFKQYNDAHGHLVGDAVLVKVSEILRKMTRAVDSVARYGGEEFVVMLLETTIATAAIVAERIRGRVAEETFEGGSITLSVGGAEYPTHGDTPEELIASADAAMYRAKSEGRNRVALAHEAAVPREREKRKRR